MKARGRRACVAALALCLAAPSGGWAQPLPVAASADFDRAVSLQQQGRHAEAAAVYRAVYARTGAARALGLAGFAEAAAGRWVEAEAALGRALEAHDDPWVAEQRPLLTAQHALARSRVGRLVVEGGVAGAEVVVEGRTRGTLPLEGPLRLPVGLARLSVRAAGYQTFARRVMVQPEGETRVLVTLAPAGRTLAPDPDDDDDTLGVDRRAPVPAPRAPASGPAPSPTQAVGYVALGFGLAGLSAAGVGLLVHDAHPDLAQGLTVTGLVVGGVSAALGGILLAVGPGRGAAPRVALGAGGVRW